MFLRILTTTCILLFNVTMAQNHPEDLIDIDLYNANILLLEKLNTLEQRVQAIEKRLECRQEMNLQQKALGRNLIHFDTIHTNLREENHKAHHIQVSIMLSVEENCCKEAENRILQQMVPMKDWLFIHLSDKTMSDLCRKENQLKLRTDIHNQFNKLLQKNNQEPELIKAVLFDKFAVK